MASEKTVVLVSGGLDSAVLLHQVQKGGQPLPVFIDYGQRAVERERAAALVQCGALGLELTRLDATAVAAAFHAKAAIRPHSPLPLRNLVLMSLALSYADLVQAGSVATAVIRDDIGAYPCTAGSFWYAFRDLAATMGSVRIETPLIYLDKVAVIAEGLRLGVDLCGTYSCSVGEPAHCGRCRQCVVRRAAALKAGLLEPDDFYLREAREPLSVLLPPAEQARSTSGAWRW